MALFLAFTLSMHSWKAPTVLACLLVNGGGPRCDSFFGFLGALGGLAVGKNVLSEARGESAGLSPRSDGERSSGDSGGDPKWDGPSALASAALRAAVPAAADSCSRTCWCAL